MANKNVLLLGHDGEDFYKARIPFAKYLRNNGYNVSVMLPHDKFTDLISQAGFNVGHSSLERDNTNPLALIKTIFEVREYARKNDIDLVHSFKFVPNLINAFSNIFTRKKVVLHIAGLGIAFANTGFKYKLLKFIQQLLFFVQFLRANLIIIQNPDDYNDFLFKKSFRNKIKLVKGSGVDIVKFSPSVSDESVGPASKKIIFLCTTRLIWEKGIKEMVESFELLSPPLAQNLELHIIGEPDDKNPRSVTEEFIAKYASSHLIRFLGRQENVQQHLVHADVFILPSYYREGIPRSILEALACAKPVITTNVPGCNLTILDDQNGRLIAPRSVQAIKSAVEDMIASRASWPTMGNVSRQLAVKEFSEEKIFSDIVNLYK